MRDIKDDAILQMIASLALLKHSRLVQWERDAVEFSCVDRATFERAWQDVDPVFGRLICWINFSAGAEFLAKGVCLLHQLDMRSTEETPAYPENDLDTWADQYCKNSAKKVTVTNFGSLGSLIRVNQGKYLGKLKDLCTKVKATPQEEKKLLAAYDLLRSIRNRDAHAYVPNVRDSHFWLVPKLFSGCFNLLVSWIPDGKEALNDWIDPAPDFIASL